MRLKKIRLAGFKSFVDPTNIPFPGDMTAVVGPNGCGKSNVIDAVRWVLGESSAKNLRGDAMTDVIFNGSSVRKAVSQCSVELVFDNTSGRIKGEFAAFNEISVKRTVTKEAVSSYFLNATKCRRRDITDLFLGTGLGPRSYAIIEQGMISKLIESKPQELRVFIEEAAGISKYKERRKETQTRISHTKENLDRLDDVRQELGDQLEKLKRQAVAATRYKDLKQQERLLKAQLATIKWLTQSQIMNSAQTQISQHQVALNSLLASQQGDESGLHALKIDQAIAKQKIDEHQQQIFGLGTDITKLEQSQLFARKRTTQIQAEIGQLKQLELELGTSLAKVANEIEQHQEKLLVIEPEKEFLEAQLYDVEERKQLVDDNLSKHSRQSKLQEDAFYSKTKDLQQKQGQIQQTLSLQERTENRLHELTQELSSINQDDVSVDIDLLQTKKHGISNRIEQQKAALNQHVQDRSAASLSVKRYIQQFETSRNELTRIQAKIDALQALQISTEAKKDDQPTSPNVGETLLDQNKVPMWEYFTIQKGAEKMLSSALYVESGYVLDISLNEANKAQWSSDVPLMFSRSFTQRKKVDSLAELVTSPLVPDVFNNYFVADNHVQGAKLASSIAPHERVLLPDGSWFTHDSFIYNQPKDSKILRAAQIESLKTNEQTLLLEYERATQQKERVQDEFEQLEEAIARDSADLSVLNDQLQTIELSFQNLVFQQSQFAQRTEKLLLEITQHKERLAQEQMSLELLSEQVEDLSIEVITLETYKNDSQQVSEQLRQQQQALQAQQAKLQSQSHAQAMQTQQVRNSVQMLQVQQRSKQQLQQDNQEKVVVLQDEAQDLLLPELQQQTKLQDMLEQQTSLRSQLIEKQQLLTQVESDIADIEKGQHGMTAKMDSIKSEIESHRIRSESAKVRAQSYIEQLTELKQSVKDIIETLPDNANDKEWQSDLDKVSASIQRLGAVNLAAVDEYDEQAERKAHLDAQNLDLTQALDTLENAMRKIDKETRGRFKRTFDQVNADLKSLFPKVFGGGMAYLALTDDDMLDTGVTIMARPPGKKNSTIHLLSGGEKALTALSLVFAIFRLNPAPFCLLDEVDAPLDDANVGRFCRLVSQMSESVQFIYITHNKVAMEMATHLIGVTMAEPGVSRMVAVDMEQALAIAE